MAGHLSGIGVMVFGVTAFAGWLTHIYVCFTEYLWGFLIVGLLCFPLGIVHGWGRWIGLW
jgi:hypothetical protein